jgi:hypothetical protein
MEHSPEVQGGFLLLRNWSQLEPNSVLAWLYVVDFVVARDGIGIWPPVDYL